ncbi:MAG: hypothetical protein V1855_03260 [bacterium]
MNKRLLNTIIILALGFILSPTKSIAQVSTAPVNAQKQSRSLNNFFQKILQNDKLRKNLIEKCYQMEKQSRPWYKRALSTTFTKKNLFLATIAILITMYIGHITQENDALHNDLTSLEKLYNACQNATITCQDALEKAQHLGLINKTSNSALWIGKKVWSLIKMIRF